MLQEKEKIYYGVEKKNEDYSTTTRGQWILETTLATTQKNDIAFTWLNSFV